MAIVRETKLPGVGVRHDYTTSAGTVIGVLQHHDGRHDLLLYKDDDPDCVETHLHLDEDDTRTLAELLGASRLQEGIGEVQAQIEGLTIAWIAIPRHSPAIGVSLSDGEYRNKTGTSIVAAIRRGKPIAAPDADFAIDSDDTIVAVGTPDGLDALRTLLAP